MAEITPIDVRGKNGKVFTIRHCVEADAVNLLDCVMSYIEEGEGQVLAPGEFKVTEEQEARWIKSHFEHPNDLLLVAEFEGRLIGSINFTSGKRLRVSHCGDIGMGILEEWRSQGVGSALLSQLLTWVKSNHAIEKINLRVLASNNRAIGLYKKFGFQQDGYCDKYVKLGPNKYDDVLLMSLFAK